MTWRALRRNRPFSSSSSLRRSRLSLGMTRWQGMMDGQRVLRYRMGDVAHGGPAAYAFGEFAIAPQAGFLAPAQAEKGFPHHNLEFAAHKEQIFLAERPGKGQKGVSVHFPYGDFAYLVERTAAQLGERALGPAEAGRHRGYEPVDAGHGPLDCLVSHCSALLCRLPPPCRHQ